MKLKKFRVTKFRSVMDSGWLECNDVTNIVGVNEAGKSNLLLALWKLNPATDGNINLLADLPRSLYSEMKDTCGNVKFIETYFELDDNDHLFKELVKLTNAEPEELKTIYLARCYKGSYYYHFPNEKKIDSLNTDALKEFVNDKLNIIQSISSPQSSEMKYKNSVTTSLNNILLELESLSTIDTENLNKLLIETEISTKPTSKSMIFPIFESVIDEIKEKIEILNKPPIQSKDVWAAVYKDIPHFVYYSNYGNLDSEIYLPHVIENLKRTDISGVSAAKTRTLKVLFNFIKLNPEEILELGKDSPLDANGIVIPNPTPEQLDEFSHNKAERTVLLNAASNTLTKEFRNWWKQGNYVFDLRADGKFFKIWVSDDKRLDKVELESRSTGLQWFLSFYLIFLVETKEKLQNSILLLDEAGLSLHPLAQKDLIVFFNSLAQNNQIIHTTHSPFLVDTNNIDNVKVAYVDEDGYTVASNNLRVNIDPKHDTSVYAVHAALGLSVSDILLQGCSPVIVEGPSDQYYFNAIKNHLISTGKFSPKKEIVFIPSGGVKGISAISSIISSRDSELPFVIIDSDKSGKDFKAKLERELYKELPGKIIEIASVINKEAGEVEDLIPVTYLEKPINKLFKDLDDVEFWDEFDESKEILPQLETFAKINAITLPKGYKVEIAKAVKQRISKAINHAPSMEAIWINLFEKINV